MKRIDVSLNVGVIAPLLDFLKPVLKALESETAFAPEMAEADRDLAGLWREGLLHTQVDDCRRFLALFDKNFLNTGQIGLTEENADAVLRATSAVRLKLRTNVLMRVPEAEIRDRAVNLGALTEAERSGYAALRLMDEIQDIILQHLVG
jgi:hypothetical protein